MKLAQYCLQIDVGNSGAKWRLVEAGVVKQRGVYLAGDAASAESLLACAPAVQQAWIASVASPEAERGLADLLRSRWGLEPWFARTPAQCGQLRNSYQEPGRMGVDRWLAMLAGFNRRPGRLCVVDAGSALTIDLVAADGRHEGGYIIPGPALMERALLLDTDRVRFVEAADFSLAPGTSTAEAVRHGIALAQAGALALVMDRAAVPATQLLFCGGGGQALQQLLDRGGEYQPELVFEGLQIMAAETD